MELKLEVKFDDLIKLVDQLTINDKIKLQALINESIILSKPKKKRKFGILKDQIKISEDFDEPLEDFKEYM